VSASAAIAQHNPPDIGEGAQLTDTTHCTIRYREEIGLLDPT
jgi:hypothetical protein